MVMKRSLVDDLKAWYDEGMLGAPPPPGSGRPTFILPTISPTGYLTGHVPYGAPGMLAPDSWAWYKQPSMTFFGAPDVNPTPYGPAVVSRYPAFVPSAAGESLTGGWTGWSHQTSAPRGIYRWWGPSNVSAPGATGTYDLLTYGLACSGPNGDTPGLYLEHGNEVQGVPAPGPAVLRVVGAGGVVIATVPWPELPMGASVWSQGGCFYEAQLMAGKVTLRAWTQALSAPYGWVEVKPLVWEGDVPSGDWTQTWSYSDLAWYVQLGAGNAMRATRGPVTWIEAPLRGGCPPLRQYPRSDGLTGGGHRSAAQGSVSRQGSARQGWAGTHL